MKKIFVPQHKLEILAYFSLYNFETNGEKVNVVDKADIAEIKCIDFNNIKGSLVKAGLDYIPFSKEDIEFEMDIISDNG